VIPVGNFGLFVEFEELTAALMEIIPVECDNMLVITDVSEELAVSVFIAVHSEPPLQGKRVDLFYYLIFENIVRR